MDFRQLFADAALKQEFLDRFDEISAAASASRTGGTGGFEGLEGGLDARWAADAVDRMAEGAWTGEDPGLEAIIQRFARPVHLIRRETFDSKADGFPQSEQVTEQLEQARIGLEAVIPSVGRIDLRNHQQLDWVGTGWMVAPGLVVTNRHVASEFARQNGQGFSFRTVAGKQIHAVLDWYQEYQQPEESRFRVTGIAWIEPDESLFDVALLRIEDTGEGGEAAPPVIQQAEEPKIGQWAAVIGYPGYDSRAHPADQQRIFAGVYGYKRLAAGTVLATSAGGLVWHDATTLGGNSGSAVIDLATGRAIALHFGGKAQVRNSAISTRVIQQLVQDHAG